MRIILFLLSCMCINTSYGLLKTVWEGEQSTLSCSNENEGISITTAYWTMNKQLFGSGAQNYLGVRFQPTFPYVSIEPRNLVLPFGVVFGGLCSFEVTDKVKTYCNGENNCNFLASKQNLKPDTSCTYDMKLYIDYSCLPCPTRSKRSGLEFSCNLMSRLPIQRSLNICPSNYFTTKHVCTTCVNTELSAAGFAHTSANVRFHGATVPTSFNTVFIPTNQALTYTRNGNLCVFDVRAYKYNCQLGNDRTWSCTYKGLKIASHDMNSGHYYNNLDT